MSKKTFLSITVVTMMIYIVGSCGKGTRLRGTDKELYELSKDATGFVWYKNSSALLNKSSGSGHPQPYLRTRFNSMAATQLDSTGKVIANASFPEGSLIVKELLTDATTIERYAILYKNSGSEDADARGWVWGYINSNGRVEIKASKQGSSCISCHTQTGNIDYMLMNKFFP